LVSFPNSSMCDSLFGLNALSKRGTTFFPFLHLLEPRSAPLV
jgi:hypothetical protein